MKQARFTACVITVLAALILASIAQAVPLGADYAQANTNNVAPVDPAELEAFLDQKIQKQMDADHIAGAVVSVVQNGEMIFAKGYGLADVEANKPVDPEKTIFHLGSITKVFTYTAVMQLVEQGKLDLNTDINNYLDFKIPDTYPQPITIAHLMSHSSGLDETFIGVAATSPENVHPLGEYVRLHLPSRVRPPGIISAYSNYGIALVGYIVERVSGQPYADYIEEHIIRPLSMNHSTPRFTLPDALAQDLSKPYAFADGFFKVDRDAWFYSHQVPAGGMRSTATDMAKFMIAHLEGGAYQGVQILKPETVATMQTQDFTADSRVRGLAHGFEIIRAEDPKVIGHGGVTDNFYTNMWLVPEARLGIFVANNTANGRPMVDGLVADFIDHYFPSTSSLPPKALTNSTTDLHALEGSYASAQLSYGTSEKVKLMLGTYTIQAQDDGSLVLSSLSGSQRYVEVEPLLFQHDDGRPYDLMDRFTFRLDPDGNVQYLLFNLGGFEKLPWYESMGFNLLLATTVMLLFLSIPIAAIIWRASRRLREQASQQPKGARWARWVMGLLVLLFFISQAGMFSAFADIDSYLMGTAYANRIGEWLAIPVSMLAVCTVIFAILAWRHGYWSIGWRIHYTLVAFAAMVQVWWFFNWKIIG